MTTVWAVIAAVISGSVAILLAYFNGKKAERLNTAKQIKKEIKKYDNIFLSSLVPVIGFALSTLSLKIVRKIWQNKK